MIVHAVGYLHRGGMIIQGERRLRCESLLSRGSSTTHEMSRTVRLLPCTVLCVSVLCAAGVQIRDGTKLLPVIDKQDIRFVTLTSGGEALKKNVRGISQDNQGFMWFATDDGFFRYDGYTLTPYRHDPTNPNSISSDNLFTVYKDRSGILWIGTVFDGLERWDPASGVFTHYRHQSNIANSLISDQIKCIYQDRHGALWIGTNGGLDRFDPATGTSAHYRHDPRIPGSLSSDLITSIYEDRHDNLWVGTTHGLNQFDRGTGRSTRYFHDPKAPHSLGHDYVARIVEDRSGVLWIGSSFGDGLCSFDFKTHDFTNYSFHQEKPSDGNLSGLVTLHEDAAGGVWLGTERD